MHESSPSLPKPLVYRKVSDRRPPTVRLQQIGDPLQAGLIQNARQHTAIALDRGAVDEVRVSAREENADTAHLCGLARTPQGHGSEILLARRIIFGQDE